MKHRSLSVFKSKTYLCVDNVCTCIDVDVWSVSSVLLLHQNLTYRHPLQLLTGQNQQHVLQEYIIYPLTGGFPLTGEVIWFSIVKNTGA